MSLMKTFDLKFSASDRFIAVLKKNQGLMSLFNLWYRLSLERRRDLLALGRGLAREDLDRMRAARRKTG